MAINSITSTSTSTGPITVASGSTVKPFAGVDISAPLSGGWDGLVGGGTGTMTITLRSMNGAPLGTIKDIDQFWSVPTVSYGNGTMTWSKPTHGGPHPGGSNAFPNQVLDRLEYVAPVLADGTTAMVYASVSFTGDVQLTSAPLPTPSNPFPARGLVGTETVTAENAVVFDVRGAVKVPDITPPAAAPVVVPAPEPVPVVVTAPPPAPVVVTAPEPTPVVVPAPEPVPVVVTAPPPPAPVVVPVPPPAPVVVPAPQPTPVVVPAPQSVPNPAYFAIANATTGVASTASGNPESASGIDRSLIMITPDSLAIVSTGPNTFIKTGSGNDAISTWAGGGTNVLDGGEGSNFLTGGSGFDTFFVDARNAAAPTWSTVRNLGAGDAATLWGVKSTNAMQWLDGQGAEGAKGLTLHADVGGRAASLTLSGYGSNDLATGRLGVSFGNVGGADYMYVKAA